MPIKPFKDKVEKSFLVGSGSTAYVIPASLEVSTRLVGTTAPSSSYPNSLRQGVSIRTLQEKTSLLPRVASKLRFEENGLFDYTLEILNYGQPKEFRDDTLFDDSIDTLLSGSPESFLTAPPDSYFPVVMFNPSYNHLEVNMMDGVIEPLPVREAMPNTSEAPYAIRGVKASLQMGNESEYAGSNIVSQFISKLPNSSSMFLDSQDIAMSSDNFKLAKMGLSTKGYYLFAPFNETLVITSSIDAALITGSYRDMGIVDQYKKSAHAGFTYFNNPDGTDSLAFGGYQNKHTQTIDTRILDKPYRRIIRQLDVKTGSYPTILRNDPLNLGNYPIRFDDTITVIYATGSAVPVQYPDMLEPGNRCINPRANSNPIVVDSGFMRRGMQQSTRDFLIPGFAPVFRPFIDSRIYLNTSSFYLTGTLENIYPGFRNSIRSKVQIKINLNTSEEKYLLRLPTSRTPTNSEFAINNPSSVDGYTGFAYYSFETSGWQDIGLTDPATGQPVPYDYSVSMDGTGLIASGTELFPMQFSNSPARAKYAGNDKELLDVGYDKIGSPINTSRAPFDKKYHATGSQAFQLTGSIVDPFLLEKVVVELPIVARRKQGLYDNTVASGHTPMLVDGGSRDIDNYVFFIYRQRRNNTVHPIDSLQDVSGSKRFLICSGSMSFINSQVTSASLKLHTPAFVHDFNIAVSGSDSNAAAAEALYTGTIRLNLVAATPNVGYFGMSSLPFGNATTMTTRGSGSPTIQSSWLGGSDNGEDPNVSLSFSLLSDPVGDGTDAPAVMGFTNGMEFENPEDPANRIFTIPDDQRPVKTKTGATKKTNSRMKGFDPISNVSGSVIRQTLRGYVSDSEAISISPYLLLPTDELIFGLEYGAANNIARNTTDYSGSYLSDGGDPTSANSYSFFTGSFLKILTSDASVTLYGSQIKGEVSFSVNSLNQTLTSEAIFEPLVYKKLCLDEFDIADSDAFRGTYVEHVLTGTMAQGRAIAYSFSKGNLGDSGSIARNVRLFDPAERYYDSIMPAIKVYANEAGATVKKSSVVFPSNTFIDEKGDDRMPFPYRGNPVRNIRDTTRIEALNGTTLFSDEATIFEALFTQGLTIKSNITNSITRKNPRMQGASATRYGIKNVRKEFSSAVFRRDRFGQFRDMMEQRLYSKFQEGHEIMEAPIENIFYDSQGSRVNADLTTVGNLSRESTSSLPYFDGADTNRGSLTGSFGTLEVMGFGSIVKDVDKSEIPLATTEPKQKGSNQTS